MDSIQLGIKLCIGDLVALLLTLCLYGVVFDVLLPIVFLLYKSRLSTRFCFQYFLAVL